MSIGSLDSFIAMDVNVTGVRVAYPIWRRSKLKCPACEERIGQPFSFADAERIMDDHIAICPATQQILRDLATNNPLGMLAVERIAKGTLDEDESTKS